MDSKGLGNDWCGAWPSAEIAVMGAPGAVEILHGRTLRALEAEDGDEARLRRQADLEHGYEERFANPYVAAERGFVDDVIAATDTRRVLADALDRFSTKREQAPSRRHTNTPL
jgi:propionyl-CoA carboxylase beta chain